LAELWAYRELLWLLVVRNVKVRYAQTALGAAWALLEPVLMMALFTAVFGRLARMPVGPVPYPAFVLPGLVVWAYVNFSVNTAATSMQYTPQLVTKIYLPRLVLPLSHVLAGLVTFALGCAVLSIALALAGFMPGLYRSGGFVVGVVTMIVVTAGAGTWLAALNTRYRDIRHLVPFGFQAWLLASPIAYPASAVPVRYARYYAMNPLVGAAEGIRGAVLNTPGISLVDTCVSFGSAAILLVSGLIYFRRTEHVFADLI
jgi:lipopolysaccharide transport system permease protein